MNLLPWRKENQVKQQEQFKKRFIAAILISMMFLLYIKHRLNQETTTQLESIQLTQQLIDELTIQTRDEKDIVHSKQRLVKRRKIAFCMQHHLQRYIGFFERVIQSLPIGIYFKKMEVNSKEIHIEGSTNTTDDLSIFMDKLIDSVYVKGVSSDRLFYESDLQNSPSKYYGFDLRLSLQTDCYKRMER